MIEQNNNLDNAVAQNNSKSNISIYRIIAKITFVIFLFFTFFGTSLPFKDEVRDIDQIGTSNIINQIVYSLLFLLSCIALIPKRKNIILLIKNDKFLSLFLFWCLLSILWSDYSFVSFKRLFQIFTTVMVSLAILLHTNSSDTIMKYFKYIFLLYIIITIPSILIIPGAKDQFGQWRGLATHKNMFGQICLINILIWFYVFRYGKLITKIYSAIMLVISIIFLFGSYSATSIITFFILLFIGILLSIDYLFKKLCIGRSFSLLVMLSCLMILFITYYMAPDITESLPDYIGKDNTLSSRTELWNDMLLEVKKNYLIGCGFAGFWVIDNVNLLLLYETYNWLPNQAHNGYLDILNETGLIGLLIFTAMIIFYFINLIKLKKPHYWKWFIIATLILNLQESTLFKQGITMNMMFIFSYLLLCTKLIYQNHNPKDQTGITQA